MKLSDDRLPAAIDRYFEGELETDPPDQTSEVTASVEPLLRHEHAPDRRIEMSPHDDWPRTWDLDSAPEEVVVLAAQDQQEGGRL